jgi:hypothetical protein
MSQNKENIIYVYATEDNKKFLHKLAHSKNQSQSAIINILIDNLRKNKQPEIERVLPKFVEKAINWNKKNQ